MTAVSPSPESLIELPAANTLDNNEDDQSISREQPEDIGNDHHPSPDSETLQNERSNEESLEIQNEPFVQGVLSKFETFAEYPITGCYTGEHIKAGLRVVLRGIKNEDEDKGLGTIVSVSKSKKEVKVQWDQTNEKVSYSTGHEDNFELLLFDNAQTGVKHYGVACDACYEYPLNGIRWKCLNCDDYDLCTSCYMFDEHDVSHIFKHIESMDSKGVELPQRLDIQDTGFTYARGILTDAIVLLRNSSITPVTGRVEQIDDEYRYTFRSDAIVKWKEGEMHETQHRVGREGICELMTVTQEIGPLYYVEHLPIVTEEYAALGLRVVKTTKEYVGTIISCQETSKNWSVDVQWDNGTEDSHQLENKDLKIFDNGPAGIQHDCVCIECDECIIGMRWECQTCDGDEKSLCTECYMSDKHTEDEHMFSVIVKPSDRSTSKSELESRTNASKTRCYGIFKGTTVSRINNSRDEESATGEVLAIIGDFIEYGRNAIMVQWFDDEDTKEHNILELICEEASIFPYYPDHLPILGKDTLGYLDVNFNDEHISKKIEVEIWYKTKKEKRYSYKPVLYLIFANHEQMDKKDIKDKKLQKEDEFALMDEVLEFSKQTKLPCHVVGQKVLFHHGSSRKVVIHHKTSKDTIKELVKKGCLTFERGDTDDKEGELPYFIRMAEYVLSEKVLPVIISLRNGGLRKEVLVSAKELNIPILLFKNNSPDISVFTLELDTESTPELSTDSKLKTTEHTTNTKTPWTARKSKTCKVQATDDTDNKEEISAINDVESTMDFDALICNVVIGVSMANEDAVYGEDTELYANALSMYLLKNAKWRIPKEGIKKSFDHRSIEYIYEENLTTEFENGLWTDLRELTSSAYIPPLWIAKDVDKPATEDEKNDNKSIFSTKESGGTEMMLAVSTSELYGLIFLALLKKRFYPGAKQLVETGCVRIHHILVGCIILQEAENDWKTTHIKGKLLQRLQKAFTQRAIQITSCIYEAEHKKEDSKSRGRTVSNNEVVENELGEPIGHTSRLLLNHGYLENAIKTQNKTFLDNITVKKVLNKMWYGEEETSIIQVGCFVLLAITHLFIMPLLMINMEARPLKWLYKKYKLPFMKVFTQMLGYIALLTAYAYMLLFKINEELSYTDFFIIGWMTSLFLDETKQALVSAYRKRFRMYLTNWWNMLDWTLMYAYTFAMGLKFGDDQKYQDASKILLIVTFILLGIRILNMFSMSAFLGPKLVMIQKMFKDTFAFMIILLVMMISYNVSFYSLLYPNSELSWSEIEKVMQNGYWMLFGELNLDSDTLTEPDCTFNKTIYTSGALSRCPATLGLYVSPYLKALYALIAVILMLNLLIAIYNDTFQQVHQESEFHWAQLQTDFLEEYSVKTIFPIHLQLLALPVCLIQFILWCTFPYFYTKVKRICSKNNQDGDNNNMKNSFDSETDKLNDNPMFVRVFLYNANFDLRLKSTKEAEGIAALKSKGTMEVMEEDKISILQKQMAVQNRKFEKHHIRSNRKNDKIMKKLKKINQNMKDIKSMMQESSEKVNQDGRSESSIDSEDSDYEDYSDCGPSDCQKRTV